MSNILCGIWKNNMQKRFLNKYTSICFMKKITQGLDSIFDLNSRNITIGVLKKYYTFLFILYVWVFMEGYTCQGQRTSFGNWFSLLTPTFILMQVFK